MRFRWYHILIIVLAIIGVILACLWKFCWADESVNTDKDIKETLVVNTDKDIVKMFDDITYKFSPTCLAVNDQKRTRQSGFSDAVAFPFSSSDKEEMLKEVEFEILTNPIYADMVIRGLYGIEVGGTTIGKLNKWMNEFIKDTDAAYNLAEDVHPRGFEIWLESIDGTLWVTDEFREYAAYTCILLERLENIGLVEGWQSTENYNLPIIAKNSSRRTELADYQENKPALALRYVNKNGDVLFTIGFNKLDKRFEILGEPTVEEVETSNTGGGGTITPPPTPVPTPVPDPDPDPDPVKDPSKDPVNQGNAERGGGKNKPTDGTGEFQPDKPQKSTEGPIYVNTDKDQKTSSSTTDSKSGNTPPPADPIHKESSKYTDSSGKEVVIDDNTVISGRVTLPD